jgi:hypothetical protein
MAELGTGGIVGPDALLLRQVPWFSDTDRHDLATQIDGVVNVARRLERPASLHKSWPKRRLTCV